MKPSYQAVDFIKEHEGLRLESYRDTGGVWTIGFGTTKYPNGIKVTEGEKITEQEAEEYLHYEVKQKASAIDLLIKDVPLNQNQYDAIVSLAYNIGIGAFAKSTLLKKLKVNPHDKSIYVYAKDENGKPVVDSCEFVRWCRDNGRIIEGLLIRRAHEADLYGKQ